MPPHRGAPTLGERARKLRISKGLSQQDAGKIMGKSQAYVSLLENNERDRDEQRAYFDVLEKAAPRGRTAGGTLKAGRVSRPSPNPVNPSSFRGEPLDPEFNHAEALPEGNWVVRGICRTAPKTELVFLTDEVHNRTGLVAYRLIKGQIKRGAIITITEDYQTVASDAMEAFANGLIDEDEDGETEDDDLEEEDEE
jgi:transcriptional regulator with XRE-family HTH domain